MTEADFRRTEHRDAPALLRLWTETFGDPAAMVAEFLRLLPDMGFGLAAFLGDRLAGAAYILEGMQYVGEKELPCAYLYAVAVEPAFRGQGLGRELCRRCAGLARERGAALLLTQPAQASLFGWYEDCIGTRGRLFRRQESLSPAAGPVPEPLTAEEYGSLREQLLQGRAHMRPSLPVLHFEQALCRAYGGDLYRLEDSVAAAYREDGVCVIRELLGGEAHRQKAAALGAFLGTEKVLLCVPDPKGRAYLAYQGPALPPDCHWGISFD